MTDEADSSVVLAKLKTVALFKECNNQRLSSWGKPFSCSPDLIANRRYNIDHDLSDSLNKFCCYIRLTPADFLIFSDSTAISASSRRIGCRSSSGD